MRRCFSGLWALTLACTAGGCGQGETSAAATPKAQDAATQADVATVALPKLAEDRPILLWSDDGPATANAAHLPADFQKPDQTVCAKDPARQYIGELFSHGLNDIQVDWHWAPVIGGPVPGRPTLNQPEFFLAGEVTGYGESDDDVLADHAFGLDANANVKLDTAFAYLGHADKAEGGAGNIHTELEQRIFPRKELQFIPKSGDRTLMKGVWVLDCGHPPYGTEMHPPSFVSYGRAVSATETQAAVLFAPYRSSLLFHGDLALATKLDDEARFSDVGTGSFPHALIAAVTKALASKAEYVTAHALMVANRFDVLRFSVCAPLPRPSGAKLDASWRLTARTGVTLAVQADDAQGCVHVTATMTAAYVPAPLVYADQAWSWEQLSKSASGQLGASVDVRKEVQKIATKLGMDPNAPALQADHPPHIDAYPALPLPAGADQDSPTAIASAVDSQAFPFYGRLRAAWK